MSIHVAPQLADSARTRVPVGEVWPPAKEGGGGSAGIRLQGAGAPCLLAFLAVVDKDTQDGGDIAHVRQAIVGLVLL
jgi:hypothetical protein